MAEVTKKRIAIIGAGPSGLSQLLAFKKAEQEQRVELICFERQSDWGGLWQYTSQVGTDACGEPIHSGMYRHLWSNGPNEVGEFADYSLEHHFGRVIPSYSPRVVITDYFYGRAKAGDIRKFIRFRTAVRHVDFDTESQQFQVTIEDLLNDEPPEHLSFDHVIVATGHYHVPNMPDFEGMSEFPGRVLHSHDFRGPDEFVNQNLLVIGGDASAEDIALQCHKFGTRSITISYRTGPMGWKWPANIREVPLLQRIDGHKAYFEDGTCMDDINSVIMCTGYRHDHPFMAEHLRLRCSGNPFVPPNLYKGIFWVTEPRLAYLGMQNQWYTFTMFDVQAALVRDTFLGLIKLPAGTDEAARRADIAIWEAREAALPLLDLRAENDFQSDYIRDLFSCCEPSTVPFVDVDRVNAIVQKFFEHKEQNIVTYRDQSFASVLPPYKQAPPSRIPWIKAKDDTLEGFLSSFGSTNNLHGKRRISCSIL